ncbi:MAG: DUF4157 domain-containing protein, partial [bacterium]|nr:DUF4157 domain-containing protein [bacterium]
MAAAYSSSSPYPGDLKSRHEEGGWIYQNIVTNAVSVITTKGDQASVDLGGAPEIGDSIVVGYFHTHPNPSKEPDENGVQWVSGPSPADLALTAMWEVPAFIMADVGVIAYGPGGRPHLTGPQGLPSPGSTPAPQAKTPFVLRMIDISVTGGKWEDVRKTLRESSAADRKDVQSDAGLMKWLVGLAPDVSTLVQLLNMEGYKPQVVGASQKEAQAIHDRAHGAATQENVQDGKAKAEPGKAEAGKAEAGKAEAGKAEAGKAEAGKAQQGGGGAVPGLSDAKARLKQEAKMTLLKLRRILSKKDLTKVNKKRVFGLIVAIVDNWDDHLRADLKPQPKLVKMCAAEILKITKAPLRPWFELPLQTGKVLPRIIKKMRMHLKSPRHIGVEGAKDSTLAEDQVQQRATPGAGPSEGSIGEAARQGPSGAGGALPHLGIIQQAFGSHDVSGVRAHTGSAAREAAQSMGAHAFATGNDVAFAGQTNLHTAAHEAAHIVQQRAGVQLQGNVGQVGDRYEAHADQVADAVVAGQSAEQLLNQFAGPSRSGAGSVQRQVTNVQRTGPTTNTGNTTSSDTAPAAAAPTHTVTYVSDSVDADTTLGGGSENHAFVASETGIKIGSADALTAISKGGKFEILTLNGDDGAVKAKIDLARDKYTEAKAKAQTDATAAKAADDAADAAMAEAKALLSAVTAKTPEALPPKFGDTEATKRLGWLDADPSCAAKSTVFKNGVVAKLIADTSTAVYEAMKAEAVNYLFEGTDVTLAEVAAENGVTRALDLPSVFGYGYLQAAKKATYRLGTEGEKQTAFLVDANLKGGFNKDADMEGSAQIRGGLAQAWWAARSTSSSTDLDQLIIELAVPSAGSYGSGAVRVEFDLSSAMGGTPFKKPTSYDAMGHAGYEPNPGGVWGTTAGGALEVVAPPLTISQTTTRELFTAGSVPDCHPWADLQIPAMGDGLGLTIALNGDKMLLKLGSAGFIDELGRSAGTAQVTTGLGSLSSAEIDSLNALAVDLETKLHTDYGPVVTEHFANSVRPDVVAAGDALKNAIGAALGTWADLTIPAVGGGVDLVVAREGGEMILKIGGVSLLDALISAGGYGPVSGALARLTAAEIDLISAAAGDFEALINPEYGPVVPEHFAKSAGPAIITAGATVAAALGESLAKTDSSALTDMESLRTKAKITVSFNAISRTTQPTIQAALRNEMVRQANDQISGLNELTIEKWYAARASYQGDSTFMASVDNAAKVAVVELLRQRIDAYESRARTSAARAAAARDALEIYAAGDGTTPPWPAVEVEPFTGRQAGPTDEVGFRKLHKVGIRELTKLKKTAADWDKCLTTSGNFRNNILHVDQIAGGCWEVNPTLAAVPQPPATPTQEEADEWAAYLDQLYQYVGASAVN